MLVRRLAEHFQSFLAISLEGIRTGAGLEGAATHQPAPRGGNVLRRKIHLLLVSTEHGPPIICTWLPPMRYSAHVYYRVVLVRFARNDFVLLDDVHGIFHTGQRIEHFRIEFSLIADGADYSTFRAAGNFASRPKLRIFAHHRFDLFVGGAAVHDDNQADSPVLLPGRFRIRLLHGCVFHIERHLNDLKNFLFSDSSPTVTRSAPAFHKYRWAVRLRPA